MSKRFVLQPVSGRLLEEALRDPTNLYGIFTGDEDPSFKFYYYVDKGNLYLCKKLNDIVASPIYSVMNLNPDHVLQFESMAKKGKPTLLAVVDTVDVKVVGFMPQGSHNTVMLARLSHAFTTQPKLKLPLAKGVYIHLFHGRKSPKEELDEWGSDGPVLGPFDYAHTTYASDIKLSNDHDWRLSIVEDMVYYDGVYYGDWSVFDVHALNADQPRLSVQPYEEHKAKLPKNIDDIVRGGPAITSVTNSGLDSHYGCPGRSYTLTNLQLKEAIEDKLIKLGARMHADVKPEEIHFHVGPDAQCRVHVPIKDGV